MNYEKLAEEWLWGEFLTADSREAEVAALAAKFADVHRAALRAALDCIIPEGNPIVAMAKVRQLLREVQP